MYFKPKTAWWMFATAYKIWMKIKEKIWANVCRVCLEFVLKWAQLPEKLLDVFFIYESYLSAFSHPTALFCFCCSLCSLFAQSKKLSKSDRAFVWKWSKLPNKLSTFFWIISCSKRALTLLDLGGCQAPP